MEPPKRLPPVTRIDPASVVEAVPALVSGRARGGLDAFAKAAGPDVAIGKPPGLVRVHAVFQVDPVTSRMTVSVVDEQGNLVRLIPPDSVAEMLAAMAAYPRR